MKNEYEKSVYRVGLITIIANFILAFAKIIVGFLSFSQSLISDGIHSFSDVFSTIIVMIGVKISRKGPDKDHPFGHERFESIATIFLALSLFLVAVLIGYDGIIKIIDYINGKITTYSSILYLALICAIASIIIKGWMFVYTIKVAKKINSTSLKSDAYHHLSDSLSSFGSLLGICGLMIGEEFVLLDSIACLIISLFIIKLSINIFKTATNQLVDKSAPEEFINSILELIKKNQDIISVDSLNTRQFGTKYYLEIEITVDKDLSIAKAHAIAEIVHNEIEANYQEVKHCFIHVNPS